MAKIIIGLAGEMASGKGSISQYLEKEYGAKTYRFSDVLRNILDELCLECDRGNMSDLSSALREIFGEDIISKAITDKIKKDDDNIIVIDGVRRLDDLKYLKEIPEFRMIFVDTSIETRYERIVKRGENSDDSMKTLEEFKKDHEREAESQAKGLRDIADEVIDNSGSVEELYKQVDELVK